MKLKVNAGLFASVLSDMARIAQSRPILPVTANVMLSAAGDKLTVQATNLEVALTCSIEAKIEKEGATTVPARTLAELVSAMPDQPVSLSLDASGASLKIACGDIKSKLRTINAEEFPNTKPASDPVVSLSIASDDLVEAINQVAYAVAKESHRPVLSNVCIKVAPNEALFHGADGYRMSRRAVPVQASGSVDLIIPAGSVKEIAKIAGDSERCEMAAWSNGTEIVHLTVETPNAMLMLLLTAGEYPNLDEFHQQFLNAPLRATASINALRDALRVALVFAKSVPGNGGTISIVKAEDGDMGKLVFGSHTAETGAADATVEAVVPVEGLEVGYNLVLLAEALATMGEGQLLYRSKGPTAPGFFAIVGQDDFFHALMPMQGPKRDVVE